jgi:glutamyl-tRNA synthetase
MGQVMLPLRISLVGTGMGPDVAKILEMLGREESTRRIEKATEEIG